MAFLLAIVTSSIFTGDILRTRFSQQSRNSVKRFKGVNEDSSPVPKQELSPQGPVKLRVYRTFSGPVAHPIALETRPCTLSLWDCHSAWTLAGPVARLTAHKTMICGRIRHDAVGRILRCPLAWALPATISRKSSFWAWQSTCDKAAGVGTEDLARCPVVPQERQIRVSSFMQSRAR